MGLWRVFYADWQMECCGTPFSVGDEVSWPLLLTDSDDVLGGGWYHELSELSSEVERVSDGGVIRLLRADDGLVAALHEDPVDESGPGPDQWIRSVGVLTVERHGARWPETSGRVRAVHLVRQGYAETARGSRDWEPVPGERSLEAVEGCPKWFADKEDGRTAMGAAHRLVTAGVLVDLDVPGTPA
ncbi:DUF6578 domain-containing protein [Streptomyces phyllanthi]|uniref:Uncharacterized protein n=1 Tax=Streptomyces phyllanthi TaxID=1803180 RepID=A0A5N8WIS6_9ACTN|nr:DUF6578 domain-containing protein [Streptomyces phyllanthi]MPY46776.1 hypothetical protein [Streptomyces phyllanthi]